MCRRDLRRCPQKTKRLEKSRKIKNKNRRKRKTLWWNCPSQQMRCHKKPKCSLTLLLIPFFLFHLQIRYDITSERIRSFWCEQKVKNAKLRFVLLSRSPGNSYDVTSKPCTTSDWNLRDVHVKHPLQFHQSCSSHFFFTASSWIDWSVSPSPCPSLSCQDSTRRAAWRQLALSERAQRVACQERCPGPRRWRRGRPGSRSSSPPAGAPQRWKEAHDIVVTCCRIETHLIFGLEQILVSIRQPKRKERSIIVLPW